MNIKLSNENLTVELSPLGGELQSIRDRIGVEYLWQGDPAYWKHRAPNLFPYIGRLDGEIYTLHGKPYHLPIHGFLSATHMTVVEHDACTCALELTDTPQTRVVYPYAFRLTLRYTLKRRCLTVCYRVENHSEDVMYFGLGGHPGFRVPLQPKRSFEDYFLQFEDGATPEKVLFSEDCFVTGEREPFSLEPQNRLPLRHGLFDEDAVVLWGSGNQVTLRSADGPGLTVKYGDFPYLGLWHKPKSDAPYICLEPWSSRPGRKGVIEELSQQRDLLRLLPEESLKKSWSVEMF